ncbi:MAG: energy transducer TonB [Sphingobacteriaceae bacterium]|nr:MAG: energy transducer TonB [Sphingobacteriaceae bacterium]
MKKFLITTLTMLFSFYQSHSQNIAEEKIIEKNAIFLDTINIRGIVFDVTGKPVANTLLLSKNTRLNNGNNPVFGLTNKQGQFELKGAFFKDVITVKLFGGDYEVVNNGSRYLEIHLPDQNLKNTTNYSASVSTVRKYPKVLPEIEISPDNSIYEFGAWIEAKAIFSGGIDSFKTYVQKQLRYPEKAIANNIEGDVEIRFTVDKDGSLKDFKVLRGIGYGCEEQVIEAIKKSPKWRPGVFNGKAESAPSSVTINFKLTDK